VVATGDQYRRLQVLPRPDRHAERERSVKQLIGRVVDTITMWAKANKYFATDDDLQAFSGDLKHILVYQKAAFNSPVWFNCGFEKAPQCSACFINSVQDTMDSILTLARTEGMLFKFGSGTGTNLSPIRSSKELLAGGGTASGPVSFMKGYDAFAGVIKSGGKTRRAAKMVILNADHPDIVEFINCKVEEEKKAWALIDAGYDGSFTGPAYSSVFFQNSNNSVRVTDDFMRAVLDDSTWDTKAVRDGSVMETYKARELMNLISEGTHVCGDPGMQFDTTINEWHTCPETDRIHASNPCSEYMFLNDSACNLSSINLMKFVKADGEFDAVAYKAAIRTMLTAMEIIVDNASYPSKMIGENSHAYRPLGLGYANLGALLMSRGLPYDSDGGRDYAAALTALMTGEAYAQSSRIARDHGGPFSGYDRNREPFLRVMRKHRDAMRDVNGRNVPSDLYARPRRPGTMRWSSASSSATATRRRPCSRRPARSAS
jgi:ribonucleoside-diphosphate reductase alpha chain